jgi:hypothetical protein
VGSWQVWTLDAELGLRIPLGRIEPHVAFSGGYSSFGGIDTAIRGLQDGLDVHGADAGLALGVDWWLSRAISFDVDLQGQALAVAREGVSLRDLAAAKDVGTIDDAKARVLEANRSSWALAAALTAGLGAHF